MLLPPRCAHGFPRRRFMQRADAPAPRRRKRWMPAVGRLGGRVWCTSLHARRRV